MDVDDFEELIIDIDKNGLINPIVVHDDMVIDGWHRYKACEELNIEPHFINLDPKLNPVSYVISANIQRRHLTGSQRAAAIVACTKWVPRGGNQYTTGGSEPGSDALTVNKNLADAADVSDRTIRDAKRAHEAGLGDAVRDGVVTAKQAAQIAKLPEEQRAAALEAPPKPEPKPAPKPEPKSEAQVDSAEVDRLKARISELEAANDALLEVAQEYKLLQEEYMVARNTLDVSHTIRIMSHTTRRFHQND